MNFRNSDFLQDLDRLGTYTSGVIVPLGPSR
jgi:hypothetical protein